MSIRKMIFLAILLLMAGSAFARTEIVEIDGALGKLRGVVTVPDNTKNKKVPTVIIFHGFTGNKYEAVHNALSDSLLANGIASVRFDFNGHGKSDGKFINMSIDNELEDARRIYQYTRSLPFVGKIGIAGHSQGGVITILLSSELGKKKVNTIALMAPAVIIHDNMLQGSFFGTFFDPLNIPEKIDLFGGKITVGRDYVLAGQRMQPYQAARKYKGKVCLIHGTGDTAVPYSYSELLNDTYKKSELHILQRADHTFTGVENQPAHLITDWMKHNL